MSELLERYERLMKRIKAAGGDPLNIRLVAVSKGQPPSVIMQAKQELGLVEFGENFVQELREKHGIDKDIRWHFLGALQTNKIRVVKELAFCIQSLSRIKEAEFLSGFTGEVLIELNPLALPNRPGCSLSEAEHLLEAAKQKGLDVVGVMAVGVPGDKDRTRTVFRSAREVRDALDLEHLSIGMSEDLEIAVEEGSTMLRIGRALLGPRSNA